VPSPPPGFSLPGLQAGARIDVIDDGRGIAKAIADRLAALGVDARVTPEVSTDATGAIFARGLSPVGSFEDAVAIQRDGLRAARTLAGRSGRRVLVTLQDTGGDFGLSGRAGDRAWTGGLSGLAKTAVAEWADAAVKAIDVAAAGASPDVVAERVVGELLLGGTDVEVGLSRKGARGVVHHQAAPYAEARQEPRLRERAVLIVSGGARGVTARSLLALCGSKPRLALLGRTAPVTEPAETRGAATDAELRRALMARATAAGLPVQPKELAREAKAILDGREILSNVAMLEEAGAEVAYFPVDVRSEESVRSVVDSVRARWGAVDGLIHGAGVLADATLANQTDAQFDAVFGTKVDGLRYLLAATAADPLSLLIVFSSVAGRFGNSAQAAYSMANEVLSSVAASERARRGPRCLVRSLAWGPWAGGMVTPGLKKLFEKAGVQLIALDAGARALAREAASEDGWPQVVLMNGQAPATARPLHGARTFSGQERFELAVNATTYPFLDGHRITGAPVIPAALVIEWFLRAAAACFPALIPIECRDVKVLRGVPVDGFEGRGVRLAVELKATSTAADAATAEVRLVDEQGKPRYFAVVALGAQAPAAPAPLPVSTGAPAWPWSVEQAYATHLFHRGPFAAIRSLGVASDEGASGELAGLRALGWSDTSWISDVAVTDGAFQLGALWGAHLLGRLPLPTSIGAFTVHRSGPVRGPVRVTLKVERPGQHRLLVDLTCADEGGAVLASIRALELHLPPAATSRTAPTGDA
jgi:hypothetical protein